MAGLWDQLVDCICRPPRDRYSVAHLFGGSNGNPVFECKGTQVFRHDFKLGSGLSEGEWVTLGVHEVEDLAAVVEYLRGNDCCSTLGLWGRSMGAVTALMYGATDVALDALVLDSPFSKLTELMADIVSQQKWNVPRVLVKAALALMRKSVMKKANFDVNLVTPISVVGGMQTPVLFGHAEFDTFVHSRHSQQLYDAYGGAEKKLTFFSGDHNGMRTLDWYAPVLSFLFAHLKADQLMTNEDVARLHTIVLPLNDMVANGTNNEASNGSSFSEDLRFLNRPPMTVSVPDSEDARGEWSRIIQAMSEGEQDAELQAAIALSMQEMTRTQSHEASDGTGNSSGMNLDCNLDEGKPIADKHDMKGTHPTATTGDLNPPGDQRRSDGEKSPRETESHNIPSNATDNSDFEWVSSRHPQSLEEEEKMMQLALQLSLNQTQQCKHDHVIRIETEEAKQGEKSQEEHAT